jgi:hypothetical protein
MEDILGSHCFRAHPALNEGQVGRHCLVRVVGREEHVKLFIVGINGERVRGICRAWQASSGWSRHRAGHHAHLSLTGEDGSEPGAKYPDRISIGSRRHELSLARIDDGEVSQ